MDHSISNHTESAISSQQTAHREWEQHSTAETEEQQHSTQTRQSSTQHSTQQRAAAQHSTAQQRALCAALLIEWSSDISSQIFYYTTHLFSSKDEYTRDQRSQQPCLLRHKIIVHMEASNWHYLEVFRLCRLEASICTMILWRIVGHTGFDIWGEFTLNNMRWRRGDR